MKTSADHADLAQDVARVECWIFDLDETLYPPESGFFPRIGARMTAFIAETLDLDHDAAFSLQKRYLHEYGASLEGLARHHGVDRRAFMAAVHDAPLDGLEARPALRDLIAVLPGRKAVFTNGSHDHAARVLTRLGLDDVFETVVDLERAGWRPKPSEHAFDRFFEATGFAPARAFMVEDSARNLRPAHARGVVTALVGGRIDGDGDHVRHRAPCVESLLERVHRALATPVASRL